MNKIKGFTLIELLVVLAIIGVMFAIMTPAISSAARAGKQSSCLSNLRQLAAAWHMYALDNEGLIVGGMTGVNGAEPGYEVMWYTWVEFPKDAQGKYTGFSPEGGWTDAPLEDKLRGIRSGLLFGYVDTLKVYHCPSDRRSEVVTEPAEYPAWRSYSVGGGMNVESPYVVHATNIDQIKSPSRRYVFVENDDPRGWNMGYWDIWVPSRSEARWWSIPAGWHEDRCNWGFADGHARPQHWRDERTGQMCQDLDYPAQLSIREIWSINNPDLQWIVDHRMNQWD